MSRLASVLMGLAVAAAGSTAMAQTVRVSSGVYHVQACFEPAAPGIARCHAHIVSDAHGVHLLNRFKQGPVRAGAAAPDVRANVLPQGFAPTDLRSAYNITASGNSATTIAIVDAFGYSGAEADLGVYRSTYGLPACTSANGCFTKYNQSGLKSDYPGPNTGWSQETALDLDMASAMCPNCKIVLVEARSDNLSDLAAAVNTAARLGARVISNSYGGGEAGTQGIEAAYDHPGVAVVVSAGDDGYAAGPQFPATSPHVIAVGGTRLLAAANARGWTESAWSDAGSGCSAIFPKPAWQKDKLCAKRMVADVSAVADPATGVAVYGPESASLSAWMIFGGTSVAAPLIGGVYADNTGAVNFASNPYADTAALNDVATGANGHCAVGYFCTAQVGYDGPTGLGTPKGPSAF